MTPLPEPPRARRSDSTCRWRPIHDFGAPEGRAFYIGHVEFDPPGTIERSQTRDVSVRFIYGPGLREKSLPEQSPRTQEGPTLVAMARVIAVLGETWGAGVKMVIAWHPSPPNKQLQRTVERHRADTVAKLRRQVALSGATSLENFMATLENPVPVLQVADVERSINWYSSVLGFQADAFPDTPPHNFAILRRDNEEIMLQRNERVFGSASESGWSIYLRMSGGRLLEFAAAIGKLAKVVRASERMPYGQVEFEIMEPDGHVVCLAELLPEGAKVPHVRER